ncbi:MAG: hypothetical protein MZV64_14375 [Ignavibacteriales bacterium]|nr:hypothetical protein [Ignavibacteriales bacterium]
MPGKRTIEREAAPFLEQILAIPRRREVRGELEKARPRRRAGDAQVPLRPERARPGRWPWAG